jgi:hypothetical protein
MSDDEDNTPLPPMLQEDADATLYKYRDFASVPEERKVIPTPHKLTAVSNHP